MKQNTGWVAMEASTGIEPVYTDLQSSRKEHENGHLGVQNYL